MNNLAGLGDARLDGDGVGPGVFRCMQQHPQRDRQEQQQTKDLPVRQQSAADQAPQCSRTSAGTGTR
jgi:hypothetical protein